MSTTSRVDDLFDDDGPSAVVRLGLAVAEAAAAHDFPEPAGRRCWRGIDEQ
jgi:hypothetical protein